MEEQKDSHFNENEREEVKQNYEERISAQSQRATAISRRRRVRIGESSGSQRPAAVERIPYTMNKKPRTLHTEARTGENMPPLFANTGRRENFARPYERRNNESSQGYYEQNARPRSYNTYQQQGKEPLTDYQRPGRPTGTDYFQRTNKPQYPHRPLQRNSQMAPMEPGYMGEREGGGMHWQQRPYQRPNKQAIGQQRGKNNRKKLNQNRPRRIDPVKYQEVLADPNEPIRLNKFLANAGICSRREADELIQKGMIQVNGQVATELGTRITRQDEVLFNGKPVSIESKVYVLLNKPKNCVTTSDDPQCRLTVMDLVRKACPERIYPVGRLDRNTTGVILITNDGDLAAKLTHPKFKKKKIYHVWLDRDVTVEDMQRIAQGVELEDGEIHADAISYVKADDQSQVGIEIHSGRNRIVRRIFEYLGYHVKRLDRVYFAGLTKKNLPRGKWRYLDEQEVNNLRMGSFE
ncbi:pseudouridine synthase [Porphyromonas crevioricanis]|uniref:pseudouridine synthase n=1 Tax=Porphyromonas crevioricanis TaxID=393921 RepID=UPI000ACE1365|nr:pseudouridine synthase [Porphyromonas crevioricanis]